MMRHLLVLLTMAIFSISSVAFANWGTGQWGGLQSCKYDQRIGPGAVSRSDDIAAIDAEIKSKQRLLSIEEKRLDSLKARKKKQKSAITTVLTSKAARQVIDHIEHERDVADYSNRCEKSTSGAATDSTAPKVGSNQSTVAVSRMPAEYDKGEEAARAAADFGSGSGGSAVASVFCVGAKDTNLWKSRFAQDGGEVHADICDDAKNISKTGRRADNKREACREAVGENLYLDVFIEYEEARVRYKAVKARIRELELRKEKTEYAAEKKYYDDIANGHTDASDCIDCQGGGGYQRGPSVAQMLISGAVGALGYFAVDRAVDRVNDTRTRQGWPVQGYTAMLPWMGAMQGMSGALAGGMGRGAFGCAGGSLGPNGMVTPYGARGAGFYTPGSGAFGYPPGMLGSPYGGGAYMPGVGPWGMAGPWGGGSNFMPPGGMFIGGLVGGMYGNMGGGMYGNMGGGMYGNMGGGMYGNMGGGMYGNMGGGMYGNMIGGLIGGMYGNMGGGMYGNMMNGMGGGMYGNMMNGMGGGMYGNMMNGMGGGMYGNMMNGMGGGMYNNMTGGMMGGMMGGQMQQEWLAQQERQLNNQKISYRIQGEINELQMKLYRINNSGYGGSNNSYGGYGSSYGSYGTYGSGLNGGGSGVLPYPPSNGSNRSTGPRSR